MRPDISDIINCYRYPRVTEWVANLDTSVSSTLKFKDESISYKEIGFLDGSVLKMGDYGRDGSHVFSITAKRSDTKIEVVIILGNSGWRHSVKKYIGRNKISYMVPVFRD